MFLSIFTSDPYSENYTGCLTNILNLSKVCSSFPSMGVATMSWIIADKEYFTESMVSLFPKNSKLEGSHCGSTKLKGIQCHPFSGLLGSN